MVASPIWGRVLKNRFVDAHGAMEAKRHQAKFRIDFACFEKQPKAAARPFAATGGAEVYWPASAGEK
jgi:hypothetical protein